MDHYYLAYWNSGPQNDDIVPKIRIDNKLYQKLLTDCLFTGRSSHHNKMFVNWVLEGISSQGGWLAEYDEEKG